ncbi:MAG: nucleotide exchange factor GrpE [Oscillospiraceae bacterium]|nr:nucleotide exchange factor GrpE [Oscillospiraceae bacterium]
MSSKKEKPMDPEVETTETAEAVQEPASQPQEKEEKKSKRDAKKDDEVKKLQEELAAAQKQAADTKDQLLRVMAEYDNYRKRTDKEKAAIYDHAVKDAVAEILNVVDTMEMALAHKDCQEDDLRKGVELIDKNLKSALTKLKVEAIGAEGEPFDPELHQAVSHIENEELGENVIAQVYRKGYRIGDKIIRHATVVVAN